MKNKKKTSEKSRGKETYIVQIYRKDGKRLAGTIEDVESGKKSTFTAGEELIHRLKEGREGRGEESTTG